MEWTFSFQWRLSFPGWSCNTWTELPCPSHFIWAVSQLSCSTAKQLHSWAVSQLSCFQPSCSTAQLFGHCAVSTEESLSYLTTPLISYSRWCWICNDDLWSTLITFLVFAIQGYRTWFTTKHYCPPPHQRPWYIGFCQQRLSEKWLSCTQLKVSCWSQKRCLHF